MHVYFPIHNSSRGIFNIVMRTDCLNTWRATRVYSASTQHHLYFAAPVWLLADASARQPGPTESGRDTSEMVESGIRQLRAGIHVQLEQEITCHAHDSQPYHMLHFLAVTSIFVFESLHFAVDSFDHLLVPYHTSSSFMYVDIMCVMFVIFCNQHITNVLFILEKATVSYILQASKFWFWIQINKIIKIKVAQHCNKFATNMRWGPFECYVMQ